MNLLPNDSLTIPSQAFDDQQISLHIQASSVITSIMAATYNKRVVDSFHSLENLSTSDQRKFNLFSRGPTIEVPYKIIHHAFEAVATRYPKKIAVRHFDGTSISYSELDQRASVLANELRDSYGVQRDHRVLLVYSRCIEMVIFILGVLKAGGQYV